MAVLDTLGAVGFAEQAGFTGSGLETIVAIAWAESGLNTAATNTAGNTAGTDRGILQINSYYHAEVSDACAFDPGCAFQQGYRISQSGTNFSPWATYTNGAYKSFLAQVQQAIQQGATGMVHWQQPGLMAVPERDGHGDSCAVIVMQDYLHLKRGTPLDMATLDAMRADCINWGLMNVGGEVGMTLQQIRAALSHYGVSPVKFVDYNPTLDVNSFHQDLISASLAHQLVIILVTRAYALPDNQSGVDNHFVLTGGIDSQLGYYTCNGDTNTALRSTAASSPVWYGIGALEAAAPKGYIVLPSLDAPAPTPAPTGGDFPVLTIQEVAGWFTENPDGSWQSRNGFKLFGLIQSYYQNNAGLRLFGLPITDELIPDTTYNGRVRLFERHVIVYDPEHRWDAPPTEPDPKCYSGHIDKGFANQQLLSQVQAQLDAALAKLAAATTPPKYNYSSEVQALTQAVSELESALKQNGEV